MKNCIRIFIAAVLLALPVVFTACSSDDGPRVPKGPEAFEYQWELAGTVIAQGTAAEKRAALEAEEEVNSILVSSFRAKTIEGASVSVDSVKQIFKRRRGVWNFCAHSSYYKNAAKIQLIMVIHKLFGEKNQ